jgi:DNA-binding transcriptional LysR family regulator
VPEAHPLAKRQKISVREIVEHPLIGVDPNDPYGRIMAGLFGDHALRYEVAIRARFGSTVCELVTHRLGVAIIDEFTLAADHWPRIRAIDIIEPTAFQTFVVHRKDATLPSYGAHFVAALRGHMEKRCRAAAPWPQWRAAARVAAQITSC